MKSDVWSKNLDQGMYILYNDLKEEAKRRGATDFQFIPMQDGSDYGCHADFGEGLEPFYPFLS